MFYSSQEESNLTLKSQSLHVQAVVVWIFNLLQQIYLETLKQTKATAFFANIYEFVHLGY